MTKIRVHGVVTGRVQGVSFRWSMQREAQRLGVAGFVRNLPDGRVEFEAEGAADAVTELVAWAEEGPAYARVSGVSTSRVPTRGDCGFAVTG